MVNVFFVHKNVNGNGFQKIKIRPLHDFEKRPRTRPSRPKKIWPFLSKGQLNLWANKSDPKKQNAKIFFFLGATRAWSSGKIPHNGEMNEKCENEWKTIATKVQDRVDKLENKFLGAWSLFSEDAFQYFGPLGVRAGCEWWERYKWRKVQPSVQGLTFFAWLG